MSISVLRRLWLKGMAALLAAQLLIISVLVAISEWRKRRAPPPRFPHERRQVSEVDGNDMRIYTYGQDPYNAMLAAIDNARETIYLETFIWKGDPLGEEFKDRLARKAAQGVKVYVVFDSFANMVVPARFKHFPASINTLEYTTMEQSWYWFDLRRLARDHRKLLIVDHEVAFIGGFNIGKLYATQWRDTHLRIRGTAALELAYAFVDFWNNNRKHLPPIPLIGSRPWSQSVRVYRNDPARLVFPIRGLYLEAIERAERHIYVTNAYFIPDRVVLSALIAAARRGVDVRVLIPWQSNHVVADWLARGYFTQCLRNGVRIFGFEHAMIHAKTATIDGIWSTIGTANLDRLSLAGNFEINIEILDPDFAADMEHIFTIDLSNAFELTPQRWAQRSLLSKLSEQILRPLWPLL